MARAKAAVSDSCRHISAIDSPASSFRSLPAQKAGGAPVSTTARTASLRSAAASAAPRSCINCDPSALRRSGRLIVTTAIAPSISDLIIDELPLSVDARAIGVNRGPDIPAVDVARRHVVAYGQHSRMTDGMTIRETLGGHACGCDCLMLCRQAAAGYEQTLSTLGNETAVGHFVVIVEQPFDFRLLARMQFYR